MCTICKQRSNDEATGEMVVKADSCYCTTMTMLNMRKELRNF